MINHVTKPALFPFNGQQTIDSTAADAQFNSYSTYYNLLYKDKNYLNEVAYIHNLLTEFEISGNKLLEFGSGTGKHAQLLTELGYDVVGVERSHQMASQAVTSSKFKCVVGDITTIKLGTKFDAILSLFHVVSYLTTNHSLHLLFENAREHLFSSGLFIFDVWYTPSVIFTQPEVKIKRISDELIEITRIAEPIIYENLNRVDVLYTIFSRKIHTNEICSITETHRMRHFSTLELEFMAEIYGFKLLHTEEFLTKKTPSVNTWGVCFVFKKI